MADYTSRRALFLGQWGFTRPARRYHEDLVRTEGRPRLPYWLRPAIPTASWRTPPWCTAISRRSEGNVVVLTEP